MRKKVFFALGCVLYLTGCDSSSLEKVIPQTKFFPIQFSIQMEYLQPIVTQYLVCNKSEIWP